MSIDPKFAELTADILETFFMKCTHRGDKGRTSTRHLNTPCGCSEVLSNPLFITPSHLSHPQTHLVGVRTSYHTPWFITPPLGPLRAALYHPRYPRNHTPHRIPHPVMIFLNPKMLSRGCVILCQVWYSYKFAGTFSCAQVDLRKARERELATLDEKSTISGIAEPYAR